MHTHSSAAPKSTFWRDLRLVWASGPQHRAQLFYNPVVCEVKAQAGINQSADHEGLLDVLCVLYRVLYITE
jgi:hypothetical protein